MSDTSGAERKQVLFLLLLLVLHWSQWSVGLVSMLTSRVIHRPCAASPLAAHILRAIQLKVCTDRKQRGSLIVDRDMMFETDSVISAADIMKLRTSLVLGLRLRFDQIHLAAGDAQRGEVDDAGLRRLSQVSLLAHVGFGLVGLQHEVFERQQLVLLGLGHPLHVHTKVRLNSTLTLPQTQRSATRIHSPLKQPPTKAHVLLFSANHRGHCGRFRGTRPTSSTSGITEL